jgi:hypothetical protein
MVCGEIALIHAEDLTILFVTGIAFIPVTFRDFRTLAAGIATPGLVSLQVIWSGVLYT